jgi:radical SAM superfamily enzyme YgiQ (UPF0313 family)
LAETGADLLVYGMGELLLKEILRLDRRGVPFANLTTIPHTAVLRATVPKNQSWEDIEIASHEDCLKDKLVYSRNFRTMERESNKIEARRILQRVAGRTLVINPPYPPMQARQIDELFHAFKRQFEKLSAKIGKKQQLIPYFISSHPGTSTEDIADLSCETAELGFHVEQVQDFTPTPMTVATEIYYSGVHSYTGKPVSQNKDERTKKLQNMFFFWYKKGNIGAIKGELAKIKRSDLWERLTIATSAGISFYPTP